MTLRVSWNDWLGLDIVEGFDVVLVKRIPLAFFVALRHDDVCVLALPLPCAFALYFRDRNDPKSWLSRVLPRL
ncbi:MAG: hypothetical protein ACI8UP_004504 [Porticoccaceae bacterium]|jgi:hypothetical protein